MQRSAVVIVLWSVLGFMLFTSASASAQVDLVQAATRSTNDCNAWSLLSTSGPDRVGAGFAYDTSQHRLVVFGGGDTQDILWSILVGDTWEWDGVQWQQMATSGPQARANFVMVYDKERREVVLFGGWTRPDDYFADTWVWNGSNWELKSASGPTPRANCAFAYDEARHRVVVFGGSLWQTIYGETWEWDGSTWTLMSTTGPSPRVFPRMAYDSRRNRCVLFGGQTSYDGTTLDDTWEWDGSNWVQVASGGPPGRVWHVMTYDPIRGRTIVFGGGDRFSPTSYFSDAWEWNGVAWELMPTAGPSGRAGAQMVYDDGLRRVVMHGGSDNIMPPPGGMVFPDLWAYPCGCNCPKQGDISGDGVIDVFDVIGVIGIAFSGETDPQDPSCPKTRGDVDNNGVTDVFDVIYLIATAFSGGANPVSPCGP